MGNKIVRRYDRAMVPIVGDPGEVAAALEAVSRQGRLMAEPTRVRHLRDGRIRVDADMLTPVPRPALTARAAFAEWRRDHPSEWRRVKWSAVTLTVVGGLSCLAVMAVSAVASLAGSGGLGAVLLVGAALLLAIAARFKLRSRGRGRGYCETTVTHRHYH